jgi:hypothetical protein
MRRVFEIDLLECPKCKSKLRIVAFTRNHHEIEKCMLSMGIPKSQSLLPIPRPYQEDCFDAEQEFPMRDFEYL